MTAEIVNIAERIARAAHSGQFRRDGRTPYITHPERVAVRAAERTGNDPVVVAAAWLHDVLEDTAETVESLQQAGIPAAVIAAVDLVTKRDGVAYDAYLAKIRQHDVAREVKIADMLDNLSDTPKDTQIVKYARGLLVLADNSDEQRIA